MGVASGWVGLSVRRVVGFGGRVCGGNRPRMKTTNKRINGVQMGVASGWVGLSTSTLPMVAAQRLRRILDFGGRVRGEGAPRLLYNCCYREGVYLCWRKRLSNMTWK
jgi:hypothetical protein